ncbi:MULTISPECIES: mannose-1-phosphate guanyltransferase [unclassified Thermosynechococcus]|uniref:mannose-1-phosphate guanyltransferase n=1 Tax=unclassified Thermosynechococcus TaxID=2622553 RepID=UPI001A00B6F9|nr:MULTISPECIES: mannose-1-phosphate guanyltransferase [unclassified Thermosynechococcus]HIK35650.1 mannose-1-phosphate guanyltransferase [Thermosynechococcus sp. M98_K2018_005]HIK48853.1 mannose-1-phosphate guanyltransferase [Thermosynechococcus sp. M55_K2018_012]
MRVVLMAGGSGTRLRPLTCDLPKPMVPVVNRPIAEHILNLLRRHSLDDVVMTLHYLPDVVRDYFGDGNEFGVHLSYVVEEEQPLGTAGSVKNIANLLTDPFLVVSGDSITDVDLTDALRFHQQHGAPVTLILARVPQPKEFGIVFTDSDGRVRRFLEKPSAGEIFTDTVNTGIYILSPAVMDYLNSGTERDFSRDLFPLLLQADVPMYGYITDAYWCDVGSLQTYQQVQQDALYGRVHLEIQGHEVQPQIWIGHNTTLPQTVQLEAPLVLGNNCRLGAGATLGAGTVLGDHVIVGNGSQLRSVVAWSGCFIGDDSELEHCILARHIHVDRHVRLHEGVVIGSRCVVGEEASLSQGVRLWPGKRIEAGAIVNESLIWGTTGQRYLFGQRGVAGVANVDITPEFAVRLAAAYASILEPGTSVLVSRDQRNVSRMVAHALMSGLMSVGIHVLNLEAIALPIARFAAQTLSVSGGIHVRAHPDRADQLLIEFFDHKGINLSKAKERQIETAYFREDTRRALLTDVGVMTHPNNCVAAYAQGFEKWLNTQLFYGSPAKIVIDYAYAVSGVVLPQILSKFGCDAVVLNATLHPTPVNILERQRLLRELGQVVTALSASLGVQVSANGERFTLVDNAGQVFSDQELTALMTYLTLLTHAGGTVVVPVTTSSAVEAIAHQQGGQIIRSRTNPTDLMEACQHHSGVVLGGSAETGFIFPKLHPGFDAMFTIATLIELLALIGKPLTVMRQELPRVHYYHRPIRCPWIAKGSLMRHLVETHPRNHLSLIDGVKIGEPNTDHWVLILPDASEPLVHLYVNSPDATWSEQMLQRYSRRIEEFARLEPLSGATIKM